MLSVKTQLLTASRNDTVVIFVDQKAAVAKNVPGFLKDAAFSNLDIKDFQGTKGAKRLVSINNNPQVKRILLVGLGEKQQITAATLRTLISNVCKYAENQGCISLSFFIGQSLSAAIPFTQVAYIIAEIAVLATYIFDKYKTHDKKERRLQTVIILVERSATLENVRKSVRQAEIVATATNEARDIVNEPANEVTPQVFAERVARRAQQLKIQSTVLGLKEITKEKMGGLLAVSQGSSNEPAFVILRYRGSGKKKKTVCLVGKGISFDSGGLSMKTGSGMMTMKYDVAGGAACAFALFAAAQLKVSHDVIVLLPLAENAIGSNGYRPGDVIRTMSGQTVEVLNTDAEGRMLLADALHYAKRYKPDVVIDVATLTNAARVCLGEKAAVLLGNNQRINTILQQCGDTVGERLWPLPLWDDYQDDIRSEIADIRNVGFKGANSIIGAAFLANFIPQTAWVHLDIAATAWDENGKAVPKGATGFGVRLLVHFLHTLR